MTRPFRFGMLLELGPRTSMAQVLDTARRAEDAGCSIVLGTDHFNRLGVLPILQAVAERTSLRIGTLVMNDDMRHPAVLAQDLAAIDHATDGRLEIGLGAGWDKGEYDAIGVPFDPAGRRVDRLQASVRMLKQALEHGRFEHAGDDAYPAMGLRDMPPSLQRPHPPILVGGGSPRVLRFAGREADIIGLDTRALPDGTHDGADLTEEASERKISWIREGAGERLADIEISTLVFGVVPEYPAQAGSLSASAGGIPEEQLVHSPHYLTGDTARMIDALEARRERWGISYPDAAARAPRADGRCHHEPGRPLSCPPGVSPWPRAPSVVTSAPDRATLDQRGCL
ncbi:MAG TPA: TIGR03621 family F420-dependent LLM class oxidoreductase [Candidatus Limnocylindrales bacterium]|nr:TIGR03621 family F420-dependent LLM class oxidoreductase [Candidatus Limnocylindrales bacterium]